MEGRGGRWRLDSSTALYGGLLVILCLLVSGVSSIPAKVYGVTSLNSSSTSDDYILVFKNHSCNFAHINNTWRDRYGSGSHYKWHRAYRFGKFAAVKLSINSTTLQELRKDPQVKYVEVNRQIRISQSQSCDRLQDGTCMQQSSGSSLWGLSRTGARTLPNLASAKYTFLDGDGVGVDVYVVDTGVYPEHDEFEGRATPAFVSTELQSEGPTDLHGHGTHVSGTIAGKTYGLAKKANIIAVKVLGKDGVGTLAGLLEGLQWVHQDFQAKKTAKGDDAKAVVNLSLGGAPGEIQTLDEAAITLITEGGLPFVIAAGNDQTDACLVSPGRVSVAITAGAINQKDVLSTFSNFGPCVDVLAPGELILSAYIGNPKTSALMSGTSMATPHVTGVIARYLGQSCAGRPTPSSIKAWIQDMATKSVVDLQTRLSTPNRLLYMFCLAVTSIPGGPSNNDPSLYDTGDYFMYIYIGIGVVGILCLIVLAFTCVTYGKIKDVKDAQARPVRQYYQPTYQTFQPPRPGDAHPTA